MLEWLFDLFKSDNAVHIYYHRDFDGVISAVVLSYFLSRLNHKTIAEMPVDYPIANKWKLGEIKVKKPFAVVDFFYLPGAFAWFDHHQGNKPQVISPETRYHLFDQEAPSCASIILEMFGPGDVDIEGISKLEELVKFDNIIDCSTYNQYEIFPLDVLFPDDILPKKEGKPNPVYKFKPGLIVSKALETAKDTNEIGFWNSVVKKLTKNPSLDDIAQDLRVQYFYRLNMAKQEGALKVLGDPKKL